LSTDGGSAKTLRMMFFSSALMPFEFTVNRLGRRSSYFIVIFIIPTCNVDEFVNVMIHKLSLNDTAGFMIVTPLSILETVTSKSI